MSILILVSIDAPPEVVQRVELENAEVVNAIGVAAAKYCISHRRLFKDDRVMDLDEFASEADYQAFIAEVGPQIERYSELIGTPVTDAIWTVDDTPFPD